MKIAVAGGHSKAAPGASHYIDEYTCDRELKDSLISVLKARKYETVDCSNEEKTQSKELVKECEIANNSKADLFIALHFNSSAVTSKAMGSECLYYNKTLVSLCENVAKKVSGVLNIPNRGAKYRDNLYVLKHTNMKAILPEICFVDSKADTDSYLSVGAYKVACSIADAVDSFYNVGWKKDGHGWWFKFADGSYPSSKWVKLDAWYYFDASGYALADTWKKIGGYWYYFGSDCRMKTGWVKLKGLWYYLNPTKDGSFPEGSARVGWLKYKNNWYYLKTASEGTECSMACNETMTIDGKSYMFNKSGAMQ